MKPAWRRGRLAGSCCMSRSFPRWQLRNGVLAGRLVLGTGRSLVWLEWCEEGRDSRV